MEDMAQTDPDILERLCKVDEGEVTLVDVLSDYYKALQNAGMCADIGDDLRSQLNSL